MLARTINFAAVTNGDFAAMSPVDRRAYHDWLFNQWSGGVWTAGGREPFTSADLQREHQADHQDHIANGEVRIGRRT